jgi:hypothetical protein
MALHQTGLSFLFQRLIFINLIILLRKLFSFLFSSETLEEEVELSIARYLNVYFLWTLMWYLFCGFCSAFR